jgi:hypothetical protein
MPQVSDEFLSALNAHQIWKWSQCMLKNDVVGLKWWKFVPLFFSICNPRFHPLSHSAVSTCPHQKLVLWGKNRLRVWMLDPTKENLFSLIQLETTVSESWWFERDRKVQTNVSFWTRHFGIYSIFWILEKWLERSQDPQISFFWSTFEYCPILTCPLNMCCNIDCFLFW